MQRVRGFLGGEGGEMAWAGRGGWVGGLGVNAGLFLSDVMWEGVDVRKEIPEKASAGKREGAGDGQGKARPRPQ